MRKQIPTFFWILGVLFVVLVIFAIAKPFLWYLILKEPPIESHDTLSSLLTITIALLALGIGAFGWVTYKIVTRNIHEEVNELIHEKFLRTIAITLSDIGLGYWNNYEVEVQDEAKNCFLINAIDYTNDAYNKYAIYLDDKIRENEKVICIIKNNLAYYLAECCRLEKDKELNSKLAIDYAQYVKKRISKYPDRSAIWQDTIDFVQKHCIKKD